MMQSLRFSAFGPPSVLRIEDLPIPKPGEGEALIHVKAAAINPSDPKNVAGVFKKTTLPRAPGRDFAGIVVSGSKYKGEEVWGSGGQLGITRDGCHAEYVVVPDGNISPKPGSWTLEQSAAIGIPYITAWASLVRAAELQAGETVLITGAGGAVGQAATYIANWKQARVIGAALSSDPIPGTEAVINTKIDDLRDRVLQLTDGKGVDVVFDTVGGALFEPALRSLKLRGRQVAITSADPHVSFNLVEFYHNMSRLIGVDSTGLSEREVAEIIEELRPGFETNTFKPSTIEVVPFANAIEAYEAVANRRARVKQILSFS
jgi:NADPH:quinone reductase-like Zn-dependent oxidoreductase